MRIVADETGWEMVDSLGMADPRSAEVADASMPPVSATVSSNAPGSGVFRKVAEESETATATDPAPAIDADPAAGDVRLPAPARLPPDLGVPADVAGEKTRVA